MKTLFYAALTCMPLALSAQILKERRVYYLDCSYSMVTNKIWDDVRDNLENAIDNVSDETTELIVIPFAFDKRHHDNLTTFSEKATDNGKAILKSKIEALRVTKNTMTYHSDPLKDFYSFRANDSRVTYMFLMTDGQNEEKPDKFKPLLQQWGKKFGNKNIYGFYVMLHDLAKDPSVENIIGSQKHLWKVPTANVDINLIRLQSSAVFNARNDKYFDVPVYGNLKRISLEARFPEESTYKVSKTETKMEAAGGKLRVYVEFAGNVFDLPESLHERLSVSMSGNDEYSFLVSDSIDVECVSKKERSLRISVP